MKRVCLLLFLAPCPVASQWERQAKKRNVLLVSTLCSLCGPFALGMKERILCLKQDISHYFSPGHGYYQYVRSSPFIFVVWDYWHR